MCVPVFLSPRFDSRAASPPCYQNEKFWREAPKFLVLIKSRMNVTIKSYRTHYAQMSQATFFAKICQLQKIINVCQIFIFFLSLGSSAHRGYDMVCVDQSGSNFWLTGQQSGSNFHQRLSCTHSKYSRHRAV